MKSIHFKISLLIICYLFINKVNGQDISTQDNLTQQIWTSYKMTSKVKENTSIAAEFGFRTISPKAWNRYYVNPSVSFSLPKIMFKKLQYKESLFGGMSVFFTDNNEVANRLELRPYQGYALDWPNWPRLRLRHSLKFEERFELNTSNWKNDFGFRFRYLLELNLQLQGDVFQEAKGIYFPISAEFFWNLVGTKQFNDVVRTNVGIGSVLSKNWRGEIKVGYNYSRDTIVEDFKTNDIIYQARLFFTIP
ncbi:DUF2490 domain-containing protein [Flammeovirga yaeyamensis]|uniref:DUF2490 domain-containing protein n=1 Tax=Flammeovirga yaeyamensis TaxID=367791 RepID=A0AAX1NCF9_9BACT|nr:DUF2490 domain-containing protein [Flammeovirga yaeyamensis]MBB3696827.1 hypothetical protein [Flammeovirga yaeyamensis]NMF33492.1 DUF2490 domain-containing protein [Flammeovirga yaeyamensis]QWG05234.1 DUF2490 domain-containing protein [Flammeovirga yaeyamensis]